MKTKTTALATVLLFSASLHAQQASGKIGVINMQKALAGTQEGQKASQDLAAKVAPKQKEFNARQQEIAQLDEQLSKGANLLNDEKKAQMARDLDLKKKRLERDTQDAEETIRTEQQGMLQSLSQRLMAVVTKFAKDNGYSLVLEAGDPNTPILYAANGLEITQDIVGLYDKTYAGASKAASPSPATPHP